METPKEKKEIYELKLEDEGLGVDFMGVVDSPAIMKNFMLFSEQKMVFKDLERQVLLGAAMIPDLLIERFDQERGSYYVTFSKDTINEISQRYLKSGFQNNINLDHDREQKVNGFVYQSFVTDSKMGIKDPKGFNNPEGTWYIAMKIEDPLEWAKIKEEDFNGFSVEISGFTESLIEEKKESKIVKDIDKLLKGDY